ncbi:MAG: hypothetical protein ACR2K6_07380, partial [Solirubrobacterales bacterium]
LVASAAIGLLPVGPSLGVTSSVLILGSKGVAAVAAAGALLTATGAVGALCFAAWALIDRFRGRGGGRGAGALGGSELGDARGVDEREQRDGASGRRPEGTATEPRRAGA